MLENYLISKICNASNISDASSEYIKNQDLLDGWRFIISSDEGNFPCINLNHDFSETAAIRSLFEGERVFVLDKDTLEDMGRNQPIQFDYSIGLDTNAASYLKPFIFGEAKSLPKDFLEVFEFISQDHINIDPLPYLEENSFDICEGKNLDKIYERLKGYEILKTIDSNYLKISSKVRSTLSNREIQKNVQEQISKSIWKTKDPHFQNEYFRRINIFRCIFLKICEIQLSENCSATEKFLKLLDFMDSKLSAIMYRELMIGFRFFQNERDVPIFRSFKKGSKKIFSKLNAVAWDFYHLRSCEQKLSITHSENTRYFFSALLTFDKDFVAMIDACPIKAVAISPEGLVSPFFADSLESLISDNCKNPEKVMRQFFSMDATRERTNRLQSSPKSTEVLYDNLVASVSKLADVPRPDKYR